MKVPLWIDVALFRLCIRVNRVATVRWAGLIAKRLALRHHELPESDGMKIAADRLLGDRPWPDKHWSKK